MLPFYINTARKTSPVCRNDGLSKVLDTGFVESMLRDGRKSSRMENSMNHSEARERRMSLNLTQDAVANIIGVSRGSLAHFEAGTRNFPPETLRRLGLVLNEGLVERRSLAPDETAPKPAAKPRQKKRKKTTAPKPNLVVEAFAAVSNRSPEVLAAYEALEAAIREDERQKCLRQLQFDILGRN